ncbi:asparaginase [Brachybacterium squillarum]|uniref:asparaginase n=1 Tax=Brachybacterium squillarum TaxID=661979 RepID=UPI002222D93F|nr:asparaginase [Brachybacterium squillarum]MCW1805514.1 asparaginase [Brachybacterium squillarum]
MTTAPAAEAARIQLLSLGGTIFMHQDADGQGAVPSDDAGARLAAGLRGTGGDGGVELVHEEIANVSSASVRPSHLRTVLQRARTAVDAGALGVVLTHGTDTLEETAFLLNRFWDRDAPLVVTGAMRPANAAGADGPANLQDAVHAAASPLARGLGVLVAFDGALHLADRVTKASSRSVSAFASEPSGPVALVDGPLLRPLFPAPTRPALVGGDLPEELPTVATVTSGLGDDLAILDALATESPAAGLRGLVVAGAGMGHVAAGAVPRLTALLEAGVPVVVATRVASGGTSETHYAYPGAGADLVARGIVMAGLLSPQKARLLLQVLLATGADAAAIREAFAGFGS